MLASYDKEAAGAEMAIDSQSGSGTSPVTIRDVAARARVSVATASRALSGTRPVSERNALLVVAAANDLGYRPNRVASALRRQVTDTIGLVVPQITNPFFPALIEAVDARLQPTTRQVLLCDSMRDVGVEQLRLQALLDRQVDGIMISPCDAEHSAEAVRSASRRVPLVQIDRRVAGEATDWVGVDDTVGIHLVVEHVADVRAHSVVFVGSEPSNSSAQLRLAAFFDASARAELETFKPLLGEFTTAWGATAADALLSRFRLPDAVVCANDLIALGLLRRFLLAGVRVPDDVLVTGFDDIGAAELSTPSLTTVRQPHDAIAAEALRLLAERAEHHDGPHQRVAVTPYLVVRESTTQLA